MNDTNIQNLHIGAMQGTSINTIIMLLHNLGTNMDDWFLNDQQDWACGLNFLISATGLRVHTYVLYRFLLRTLLSMDSLETTAGFPIS